MRALVLVVLCGCGTGFTPETLVDSLRVLAITAEPPEVGPGEPSALSVLFADPTRTTKTTVLWVGCEPDPQDLGRSACNDAAILLKPTTITDYPPGLQLLGFGPSATYRSTREVFAPLTADNPIRQSGSVGQVLGLVVGEDVDPTATGERLRGYFERIERKETQAVVGLTRVLVSEKPAGLRNRNPTVGRLFVNGEEHPTGANLLVGPGGVLELSMPGLTEAAERYDEVQPTGVVSKQEQLVGAWYSTVGFFDRERFAANDLVVTHFTAPGEATERGTGTIWLVLRDERGGQAFEAYPFYFCDERLPTPAADAVTLEQDGTVTVRGSNLDAVADVLVGDHALVQGAYSSVDRTFVGRRPELAPGTYDLRLRSRGCETLRTSLRLSL